MKDHVSLMIGFILGIIIQSAILYVYLIRFSPGKELLMLVGENNVRTMSQQLKIDQNTQHILNTNAVIEGTILPVCDKQIRRYKSKKKK